MGIIHWPMGQLARAARWLLDDQMVHKPPVWAARPIFVPCGVCPFSQFLFLPGLPPVFVVFALLSSKNGSVEGRKQIGFPSGVCLLAAHWPGTTWEAARPADQPASQPAADRPSPTPPRRPAGPSAGLRTNLRRGSLTGQPPAPRPHGPEPSSHHILFLAGSFVFLSKINTQLIGQPHI